MIEICIALDQSVSPHTGVRAIQNTGVFWQAVFQTPRPHSFFWIAAPPPKLYHNTASCAGYKGAKKEIWRTKVSTGVKSVTLSLFETNPRYFKGGGKYALGLR